MIRELEFRLLCSPHADEIYRFARTMLGSRTEDEDATQEVLLRRWRKLSGVPFLKPRAWVLRTTRNDCLDQIRRRANQSTPLLVSNDVLDNHADEFAGNPGNALDSSHLENRITKALHQLPGTWRSAFVLYESNGLRYREVAETLPIPINSVKVYISRARKRLQQHPTKDESWMSTCKTFFREPPRR